MKKLLFVGNPTILGENLGNVLKSNYNTDFISIRPKQIGNIRFSSYNALILDFTMLHKYSLTICKAAKKCCPNIIVLFLCPTSVPEQIILDFYEAGANYVQTERQFRYCGTAIPFLTVRSTAR